MIRLLSAAVCAAALTACGPLRSETDAPLSFAAFAKSYAASPVGDCDAACSVKRQELAYAVYVGKQIYAYWDLKRAETGTNYEVLARTLEERIVTGTTTSQYYTILQTWAASLHDGHVNAMPPPDVSEMEVYSAPVRVELLAPGTDHETLIVSELKEPGQLQVGDVITSVNGVATADAISAAASFASGSTSGMRRASGARKLTDLIGRDNGAMPLTLTYRRGNDPEQTVVLNRTVTLFPSPDPDAVPPLVTGVEFIKASVLVGNIGYLRIDAFQGTQDTQLLEHALTALGTTKGLILDVRQNGGGDLSGNALIARFAAQDVVRYAISQRMSDYVLSQRPDYFLEPWTVGNDWADWHNISVPATTDATKRYTGKPIVLLTGTRCFSACDTFAAALKGNHLATVVGEPTGGGTGTPLGFELPVTGFSLRYSVVRGRTVDGTWIEGKGTTPDTIVEATAADRIAKVDAPLKAALAIIDAARVDQAAAQVAATHGDMARQGFDAVPTAIEWQNLRRLSLVDGLDN